MKTLLALLLLSVVPLLAADDVYKFKAECALRSLTDAHHAEHIPDAVWVLSRPQEHAGVKFPEFVCRGKSVVGIQRTPRGVRDKWLGAVKSQYKCVQTIQTTGGVILWDAQTGWNKEIFTD